MRTIIRWPMQGRSRTQWYPDGNYQVSYQGQANLSFSGLNASFQVTSSAGGVTTGILHLEPQSHPGTLAFYVTGVNAANPLKNLHIISPDANPAISDTFRPVFLQKLAPFNGYLRMMDWMQTFGSTVAHWSDRTLPTRFSYLASGGVPYEVIAKLANTGHKDPWICIPINADDDFVHKIAQLFATNLNADRKVYVENSNELGRIGRSLMRWWIWPRRKKTRPLPRPTHGADGPGRWQAAGGDFKHL